VIRRFLFAVFMCLGGIVFYVPKWILMGTKAGRERKRLVKLTKEQNRLLKQRPS
jgi:hypothetical protein